MASPLEVFRVLFLVPVPLDLVSIVAVGLWGINVLLVHLLDLVQLPPLASLDAVHYACWFIFVPWLLEQY